MTFIMSLIKYRFASLHLVFNNILHLIMFISTIGGNLRMMLISSLSNATLHRGGSKEKKRRVRENGRLGFYTHAVAT